MAISGRQRGYDDFCLFGRSEIAITVREAHNRIGIRDIDPLGIVAFRVKGNAKGQLQAGCKYIVAAHFVSAFRRSEDTNAPSRTFSDKDIAIRCYANEPGLDETACEKLHLEARKDLQLRIGRAFNYYHVIRPGGRCVGGQKIRSPDVSANSGRVRSQIPISRLACKHRILRERRWLCALARPAERNIAIIATDISTMVSFG